MVWLYRDPSQYLREYKPQIRKWPPYLRTNLFTDRVICNNYHSYQFNNRYVKISSYPDGQKRFGEVTMERKSTT